MNKYLNNYVTIFVIMILLFNIFNFIFLKVYFVWLNKIYLKKDMIQIFIKFINNYINNINF